MKILQNPSVEQWPGLVKRPSDKSGKEVSQTVENILSEVRKEGDRAVRRLTHQFDNCHLEKLKVTTTISENDITPDLKAAIQNAYKNIYTFHKAQIFPVEKIQTQPGVVCWRESRPIDPVGLYIPGGSAPLFSSLLMLAIPARLAGCRNIIVCSPPTSDGSVNAVIRYTASLLGLDEIYTIGGAQAIGAMAYGTESVPRVQKIFGPGNAYVTAAKQQVQRDGISIDMPAGPSEVLVIADHKADPAFVASDLLSQAEHGPDSQVILATNSKRLIDAVLVQVELQLPKLPRRKIAINALEQSFAIEFESLQQAMSFSNAYAPEHLIINTEKPQELIGKIESAGSVFLGPWSCESLGDYASGTNHTLPTAGFARNHSGVSLDSFVKKITFQEVSQEGLQALGPTVATMSRAEHLAAHEQAVAVRLKSISND